MSAPELGIVEALRAILDFKVKPFDFTPEEWAKHTPETCAECKRWDEMKHPLQHRCEEWVRMFYRRKDRIRDNECAQHFHMRDIARAALKAYDEAQALRAQPAPAWDPNFDEDQKCACGHIYYRHFDSYEGMAPVGCKYCDCAVWHAPTQAPGAAPEKQR